MNFIKLSLLISLCIILKIEGVAIESCLRSVCTTLTDCGPYMELLHSTPRSQKRPLFVYLRSQECGVNFEKRMPMVCCYNTPTNTRKKYNYSENKGYNKVDGNGRLDGSIDWRIYEQINEDNFITNKKENPSDINQKKSLDKDDVSYFFKDDFGEESGNQLTTKFQRENNDNAYDLTRRRRGTIGYGSVMVDVEIR